MTEKPMTPREKFEDLAFSALLGILLLGILSIVSGCIVWGQL
jgi:hypothetical protein